MTYDPMKLCKKNDEGYFEVDPAKMFPATVARVQEWAAGGEVQEIVGGNYDIAARWRKELRGIPAEAFEMALQPYSDFDPDKDIDDLKLRARALAFAENFFSRALSLSQGLPVRIVISKNEDYRR